jgi:hypothetical protein
MPRVAMEVPHTLGQEEATRRLKETSGFLKAAYGAKVSDLDEQWNGNTLSFGFQAAGVKIAGTVTVGQSEVKLEARVPLAAMMLRGVIERKVREELSTLLAPAGQPRDAEP